MPWSLWEAGNLWTCNETWIFIATFTRACCWCLSWVHWIQSAPLCPVSLRSSSILYCHLHWVSQVASFLQVCRQTFVFTSHVHYACGMFCKYYPLLFKCHNISWKVKIVNLLIMKSHHHLVTSFLLGQDNLCNDVFLYVPDLCSSLRVRDRTLHRGRQSVNLHYSYVCWWMEYLYVLQLVICMKLNCSRKVWYESCNSDNSGKLNI